MPKFGKNVTWMKPAINNAQKTENSVHCGCL